MQEFEKVWQQLETSVSGEQNATALGLSVYLALAAVLALYIRFLFRKCSSTPSDSDSISRSFPLLAMVTTGVIAVVKSSLALSLGLVGALSIVRFRAAIKDPEELTYLFLCIAIGLSLGAEQPLLAFAMVIVATGVILGMHLANRGNRRHKLLLTISGDAAKHFAGEESGVMQAIGSVAGQYTLQRYDVEHGQGQVRIVLAESNPKKTTTMISQLREKLPDCDISYVNLNSTI